MASTARLISKIRGSIREFMTAYERMIATEGEVVAVLSAADLDEYFYQIDPDTGEFILDGNGDKVPREDLDVTREELLDARASIGAVESLLVDQYHQTNLYKAAS